MSGHPSPIHLRPATGADLPGITVVEELSFVHAGERFSHRRMHNLLTNPRAIITVAVAGGAGERVLGWAAGLVWTRGRPWGRIYALAVHPDARGNRLGPRLLHDMIAALRRRGSGRIFLEVRPDNAPAVRLYESTGFVTCRTLPNYYGPGIPAQRMVLQPVAGD
ncbi:MAG TPA: N-acetyltransferase [Tepidisphaeraceae bacterium]|jgi:ribosomal-protein-alanine N-acetyltransferase|nr:N-acetyltransferase [Tepidisphaeraceae bacterium]